MIYLIGNNSMKEISWRLIERLGSISIHKKISYQKKAPKIQPVRFQDLRGRQLLPQDFLKEIWRKTWQEIIYQKLGHLQITKPEQLFQDCPNNHSYPWHLVKDLLEVLDKNYSLMLVVGVFPIIIWAHNNPK